MNILDRQIMREEIKSLLQRVCKDFNIPIPKTKAKICKSYAYVSKYRMKYPCIVYNPRVINNLFTLQWIFYHELGHIHSNGRYHTVAQMINEEYKAELFCFKCFCKYNHKKIPIYLNQLHRQFSPKSTTDLIHKIAYTRLYNKILTSELITEVKGQ